MFKKIPVLLAFLLFPQFSFFSQQLPMPMDEENNLEQAMSSFRKLEFNSSGEFKIAQFTDTHIGCGTKDSEPVFALIKNTINIEHPDLVVLTGDIVTRANALAVWQQFGDLFSETKTPWAVVFGNHDDEEELLRQDIAKYVEKLPYCINKTAKNVEGESNFAVSIQGKRTKNISALYFLDSRSYSLNKKIEGYGWFDNSQINWYKKKSSEFEKYNKRKPVNALAFFHIPLPEYENLYECKETKCIGSKNEDISCPKVNAGMFSAMLECGDVMGVFVGHDHENDFIGCKYDMALAYGRSTNYYACPYGKLSPGSRIIVMKEGKREFDTWIREKDGKIINKCEYPSSFKTSKPMARFLSISYWRYMLKTVWS